METIVLVWRIAAEAVGFLSNLITAVLGVIAIYGLIWHRRELRAFVTLLATSHMHERVKRIKETLGKLESLNYDVKEARSEILALLGQLSGQIKPLALENLSLENVQKEMAAILNKETKLSEPLKRRILYEVHGALDNQALAASASLLKDQK